MDAQTFLELIQLVGAPAEVALQTAETAQEFKEMQRSAEKLKLELEALPEGDHRRAIMGDAIEALNGALETLRFVWMEQEKIVLGFVQESQ